VTVTVSDPGAASAVRTTVFASGESASHWVGPASDTATLYVGETDPGSAAPATSARRPPATARTTKSLVRPIRTAVR